MERSHLRRRLLAGVLAPAVTAALLVGGAAAASATPTRSSDTAPKSGTPATVSADALPTAQINGVAWAQVIVGDTVYVGGSFTTARPAGAKPGKQTVSRRNLLAYDLTTGELLPWAPRTNGEVDGLTASASGRTIYAVGHFTSVNKATRNRLVALDAATGELRPEFHPSVNSAALAVAIHGSTLYVGGHFSTASGRKRYRVAAFDAATGALRAWAPRVNGNVLAVVVASTSAVIAGRFSSVNGQHQYGSQRVSLGSGRKNLAWNVNNTVGNHGKNAAVYSLTVSSGIVYGTGYSFHPKAGTPGKRLEGTFAASISSGKLKWIEDCHGDSYGAAVLKGVVYVAGHPHDCARVGGFKKVPYNFQRALAFTVKTTHRLKANHVSPYSSFGGEPAPSILQWYPYFDAGKATGLNQGPWTVAAHGDYVAYAGEFKHVNGHLQQGLVRFATTTIAPNKQGPMLHGTSFTLTVKHSKRSNTLKFALNRDRDNRSLSYAIYRDGLQVKSLSLASPTWEQGGSHSYVDTHGTSTSRYRVVATDPFGNSAATGTVKA